MSTNANSVGNEEFLKKAGEYLKLANETNTPTRLVVKRLVPQNIVEGSQEFNSTEYPKYDISKQSSLKVENNSISQEEYSLLVRIAYGSHGKKVKCSTVVKTDSLDKFWQDYSTVLKSNIVGLIKKKKKKAKKAASKDKKKSNKK